MRKSYIFNLIVQELRKLLLINFLAHFSKKKSKLDYVKKAIFTTFMGTLNIFALVDNY